MIIWFAITNFCDQAISTPDLVMATIPQEFVCGVKFCEDEALAILTKTSLNKSWCTVYGVSPQSISTNYTPGNWFGLTLPTCHSYPGYSPPASF